MCDPREKVTPTAKKENSESFLPARSGKEVYGRRAENGRVMRHAGGDWKTTKKLRFRQRTKEVRIRNPVTRRTQHRDGLKQVEALQHFTVALKNKYGYFAILIQILSIANMFVIIHCDL